MKKYFIPIMILVVFLVGCSSNNLDQSKIKRPNYEVAGMRAEPGFVTYLDDEISLLDIPGVGTFLYDFKEEKITSSFFIDDIEYDKYYTTSVLSEDKKNIVLVQVPLPTDQKIEAPDPIIYNIKNKTINRIKAEKVKTINVKDEWQNKFKTPDWDLKTISISPENSDKEYFVFEKEDMR